MHTKFPVLFFASLASLALTACEDSGSGASGIDTELEGSWIQVSGMSGVDERDTFAFSSSQIDLGTVSGLPTYAQDGQIWETFDTEKYYKYSYALQGDTLLLRKYSGAENTSPVPFDALWANKFVRLASYTEPPVVDPALIGTWIQYSESGSSYIDTLQIGAKEFAYRRSGTAGSPDPLGAENPLFIRFGTIGETVNGAEQAQYAYRMVKDTLLLNACASTSFCSQFYEDFRPGNMFLKRP